MAELLRKGHFLGAKLRSLRRRNGLTLEELSVRCIQHNPDSAPSVSYLSMIESGKRTPSPQLLELLQRQSVPPPYRAQLGTEEVTLAQQFRHMFSPRPCSTTAPVCSVKLTV